MFAHLAVTVTLALLTAATPVIVRQSPITIPLARRFNFTGTKTLRELDLARVQKLRSGTKFKSRPDAAPASASASSFPVTVVNGAVTYTAEVYGYHAATSLSSVLISSHPGPRWQLSASL